MTVAAMLTEAQIRILEKFKKGYAPSFAPSTPEELLREAADMDAGRAVTMSIEEAEAIADALCD